MAKITYTDKVSTEVDPTIPEINKITDANMNEIKDVVNDNYDYSIYIGDEADATSDTKLLIDTDILASLGTEITNTYSTSETMGYSANYVNNLNTYSTTEQRIGTYLGKPLYRKVFNTYKIYSDDPGNITIYELDTDTTKRIKKHNINILCSYGGGTNARIALFEGNNGPQLGEIIMGHNIDSGLIHIDRSTYNTNYNIISMELILEYTKTTD